MADFHEFQETDDQARKKLRKDFMKWKLYFRFWATFAAIVVAVLLVLFVIGVYRIGYNDAINQLQQKDSIQNVVKIVKNGK